MDGGVPVIMLTGRADPKLHRALFIRALTSFGSRGDMIPWLQKLFQQGSIKNVTISSFDLDPSLSGIYASVINTFPGLDSLFVELLPFIDFQLIPTNTRHPITPSSKTKIKHLRLPDARRHLVALANPFCPIFLGSIVTLSVYLPFDDDVTYLSFEPLEKVLVLTKQTLKHLEVMQPSGLTYRGMLECLSCFDHSF